MIAFVTVARQDNCMREYLSLWGRDLQPRIQIAHYEDLLERSSLLPGTYILAAIDQLDGTGRATLTQLHQAHAHLPGYRFVNDPVHTLQRGALLDELHRRGCNAFRAVRATADLSRLRLPIFLRGESNHDGPLTPLLRTPREVDGGIALVARRGWSLSDVLAVEFCDTRDQAGLYRKYSAFFVGGRVIPRSLLHGRGWMLKQKRSDFSRAWTLEELAYVRDNPHEEQLQRIRQISGVEYGRIDYALSDGQVQTWEINLKPTIGRGAIRRASGRIPPELTELRREVKEIFYRDFQAALRALDPLEVERPAGVILVPSNRPPAPPVRWLGFKRWLRPLWPTLDPLLRWPRPYYDRLAVTLLAPMGRRLRAGGPPPTTR